MSKNTKLDRIDLNILVELQANGRLTNVELAERVGLSASPCLQRVKRLEQSGCISGYEARIDLAQFGETTTVFTEVTLVQHGREDFMRFERAIAEVPTIVEAHLVSGGYDYLLKSVSLGVAHYQSMIEDLLAADVGIAKYFSYVVIKTPLERKAQLLKSLLGAQEP